MNKQLEALIAEMKAAAQLISDGYRREWQAIHDPENGVASLGCLDDDGELSSFVEVSISNYSGDDKHDAELADYFVKAHPANVLALIAALEQAQQRVEDEICRANREHHRGFMMACRHLEEHANVHYADAAEVEIAALRNRIAELEASPLAVKLPVLASIHSNWSGEYLLKSEVIEAIRAAGGQVEGE
ncbi:ead/Ea22-like family protein [Cedecea neteri]|nr:ead/Ea22-like family protein [Cedecea neteri]WNJ77805.1 ead/Ea22-like family protein [Cedecea neteri]